MGDIHMGDTHLIALDDCASEENDSPYDHYVALIVAQHRNHFDFQALDSGECIDSTHTSIWSK